MQQTHEHILTLAARIVAAHVGNNITSTEAVPDLIRAVYETLADVGPAGVQYMPNDRESVAPKRARPAVQGDADHDDSGHADTVHADTVHADHLVCLECGMTMKMLKRHLATVHDLTPDEYRAKHNLADDYPTVTANYADLRSKLAKQSGLGKRPESEKRRRGWR